MNDMDQIRECGAPDAKGIAALLQKSTPPLRIRTAECVPSTNRLVQDGAAAGEAEGLVWIAAAQTAGRGRKGRSFHSPSGTGLYMSLLLRPVLPLSAVSLITPAAAVALCRAILRVAGREGEIKWVNDVLIDNRKVAGILTEAACDPADGHLQSCVLGVGVNLFPPPGGFPEEIADVAGAIFAAPDEAHQVRERLAAAFLDAFFPLYTALEERHWLAEYTARSAVLHRRVLVLSATGSRSATACAIDRDARLIVRYDDGTEEALCSGEVSVRRPGTRAADGDPGKGLQ